MGVKGREGLVWSHNPRPHYMWGILQLRFACLCMIMIALSVRTVREIITKCIFSVFNLPDIIQLIGLSLKCDITLSTAGQITATTAIIGILEKMEPIWIQRSPLIQLSLKVSLWYDKVGPKNGNWIIIERHYMLYYTVNFSWNARDHVLCVVSSNGMKDIFNDSQINGNIYSRVFLPVSYEPGIKWTRPSQLNHSTLPEPRVEEVEQHICQLQSWSFDP